MEFIDFNGRDIIILAVVLVAVYLLVSLLRLSQVGRRHKSHDARPAAAPIEAEPAGPPSPSDAPDAAVHVAATGAPPSFEAQLRRTSLENEVQQLRQEVAELKSALEQVKASRRVSPQYNEAMLLAQRGVNAQVIADQCAISIGEAELVAALSRNRQEYEDYDRQIDGRE